jgi:hypothetical protein
MERKHTSKESTDTLFEVRFSFWGFSCILVYITHKKIKLHGREPAQGKMSHSNCDSCTGGSRIKRSAAVKPQMLPSDQPRMGYQLAH